MSGRLCDRLIDALGAERVFFDVESIPPGADFRNAIRDAIDRIDTMLVMIGPAWAPERLAEPDDVVRFELVNAFESGKHVIPVLVGDTAMPAARRFPEELRHLPAAHAARIRGGPDFRRDAKALLDALAQARLERELSDQEDQRSAASPASSTPVPTMGQVDRQTQKAIEALVSVSEHITGAGGVSPKLMHDIRHAHGFESEEAVLGVVALRSMARLGRVTTSAVLTTHGFRYGRHRRTPQGTIHVPYTELPDCRRQLETRHVATGRVPARYKVLVVARPSEGSFVVDLGDSRVRALDRILGSIAKMMDGGQS